MFLIEYLKHLKLKIPELLWISGILYFGIYSFFLLLSFLFTASAIKLDGIAYLSLLLLITGVFGFCNRKRIFTGLFWREIFIVSVLFKFLYLYVKCTQFGLLYIDAVYDCVLSFPLYSILFLYAFKSRSLWENSTQVDTADNPKYATLFLILLFLATLIFNSSAMQLKFSPQVYNSMGVQAGNSGKLLEERRYYLKGLKAAKKSDKETLTVGKIYYNLGLHYNLRKNTAKSLFYLRKAKELYEKLLDFNNVSNSNMHYSILANTYLMLASKGEGNLTEKIHLSEKAIKIYKGLGNKGGICRGYSDIAGVYSANSIYDLADLYYKKAIAYGGEYNLNWELTSAYRMYAYSLYKQKRYKEALPFAKQAIEIYEKKFPNKQNDYYLGNSYVVLANILKEMGECDEAIPLYRKGYGIEIKASGYSKPLNDLLLASTTHSCKNKEDDKGHKDED
ncbi:MAG: hypothetical protein ACD_20C00097G0026 [uncultured bacterium]|nr:MAG: hypothetical protein ACD_20C00097G0026 [uncultured bacterium]HBH18048.1 hypothetical protein [Cyanobacteria bacterium UBA9579]